MAKERDELDEGQVDDGEVSLPELEDEVVVSDDLLEPEPQPDPEKEKLRLEIEKMQAELAAATSKSSEVEALREGIAKLGDRLSPAEAQPLQQQPAESEEAWAKRMKDEFYDDPVKAMREFSMRNIAPELQRIVGANEKVYLREISRDPQRKETYELYKDEIMAEYNRLPVYQRATDPDSIIQAHDRVVAGHIDDIIKLRLEQERSKDDGGKSAPTGQSRLPTYSEPGYTPKPSTAPGKRVKQITTREYEWGTRKGLPKEKIQEILERNPAWRKQING